jgi:hypothetical protein
MAAWTANTRQQRARPGVRTIDLAAQTVVRLRLLRAIRDVG